MNQVLEKLNKNFDNKFSYLKLLNVVFDSRTSVTTITFLYPYNVDEISIFDRKEIEDFIQGFLSLKCGLKVKFKKSFLDEKLFVNEVIEYFKEFKKGILPYISVDNISSQNDGFDVTVKISLNQDVLSLLDEKEFKTDLKRYLDKLFIANISIEVCENQEKLPDKIEAEDLIPLSTKARRYKVNIDKYLVGGDIIPRPEYIKDVKPIKESVIFSGFVSGIKQKKYMVKKGRFAGKERCLFTFTLRDSEDVIDCVYFCGKTHEKDIESIEEMAMLVCVGDVKEGLSGKRTYYVKKIALASPCEIIEEVKVDNEVRKRKHVVFPDILPQNKQENLFEEKPRYNSFIMDNNIVVFDIETTGLDPETCEITEIGAVKIEHGQITEVFSSFAKPKSPIPDEVTQLTHITNEMVANAPDIEDVIADFYDWSSGCVISGHNVVGFDLKFVRKVGSKIGLKFDNQIIDTLIVARQSNLRVPNYKLGTLVKALGLVLNDAHRAFNDAYATAQVLMELNKDKKAS